MTDIQHGILLSWNFVILVSNKFNGEYKTYKER